MASPTPDPLDLHIDALLPVEMARKAEAIGVKKATAPTLELLALAILAGAFIALGGLFATIAGSGAAGMMPYGVTRLLMGLVFCLGLILVVVGGAELFTGNNLIVMAWASGKVSSMAMLRNWVLVFFGNFVGAVLTALLVVASGHYTFGNGAIGQMIFPMAAAKLHYSFGQAVALGILCNALVCLAVWLSYSARTTTDKILAILFPVTAFVAGGFEHSVANMYFMPLALFIRQFDPAFVTAMLAASANPPDLSGLSWGAFLVQNLLPVTIGNILGGGVLVAAVYWFVYLRKR